MHHSKGSGWGLVGSRSLSVMGSLKQEFVFGRQCFLSSSVVHFRWLLQREQQSHWVPDPVKPHWASAITSGGRRGQQRKHGKYLADPNTAQYNSTGTSSHSFTQ